MYDFVLIAGAVLLGALLLWYLRHPAASAFHPASYYLLFHGVLFTLRPILARIETFDAIYRTYEFTPSIADKVIALLVQDLALAVFVLVSLRIGREPFTLAPGTAARAAEPRLTLSFWTMLALCLPPGLASLTAGFYARAADAQDVMLDMATGVGISVSGNGYFRDAALMLGPIAVLFIWACRFRWWSFVPLLAFTFFKAGVGTRWSFVMALMSAALFWMHARRRRWPPPRIALLALPLLLLFTVVGADRGAAIRQWVSGRSDAARAEYFAQRPLESMDYGNMEFTEYLVHVVPARTGTYDYFVGNLQLLTEPIPRALWKGKPIGAPIKRFNLFDYGFPIGMTYSVGGAGWMEAGWLGVALWSGLFGLFYGAIYRAYVRSGQSRYQTALYLIVLPVTLQCFRDGVLLTVLKTSAYPLIPVLLWRALRFLDRPEVLPPRAVAAMP